MAPATEEPYIVDEDRSFHSSDIELDHEYLDRTAASLPDFDFGDEWNFVDEDFELDVEDDAEQWVAPPRRMTGKNVGRAPQASSSTASRSRRGGKKKDDTWVVKDAVPGGPANASVIPSFNGHVAATLWSGQDRGVLKCHNRERTCRTLQVWLSSLSADASERLCRSSVSHLSGSMLAHIDAPLISAFVERWQPDTNSFHLPFGEMTIMMHDVWYILRIPVEGAPVQDDSSVESLQGHVAELFGMPVVGLIGSGSNYWSGGGVSIESVIQLCMRKQPPRCEETQLTAWLFLVLGSSLFIDKSGNRVRPRDILEALLPDRMGSYSWGSATLAYLYRQLGMASRFGCSGIAGCLTLLQCWIYEYFPCFRPQSRSRTVGPDVARSTTWNVRSEGKGAERLITLRERLDSLQAHEV